jgi:hypothetical protein
MRYLKQSTADVLIVGPLLAVGDGFTPVTACTVGNITCGIIKDDAANSALALTAAAGNNDFVHVVSGYWSLELTAGNTDTLGRARVHFTDSDVILPFFEDFMVVPANVYDSLCSTDKLDVSLVQVLGTAVTESTATAGVLDVNVREISDDAAAANTLESYVENGTGGIQADIEGVDGDGPAAANLEAFTDGAGYAGGTIKLETDIQEVDGNAAAAAKLLAFTLAMTTGTVSDAGATNTDFDTDLTEATNDHYNGKLITFTDGVLLGQSAQIADYVGATKNIDVTGDTFTEAPGNGDAFIIT